MTNDRSWTLAWNDAGKQWIAKFRKFPPPPFDSSDSVWGTKRVPRTIGRHQHLDAERWIIAWYAEYHRTGGVSPEQSKVVSTKKTLRLVGPRWLEYRHKDRGTKPNTWNGFRSSYSNWIRTNERFEHATIDNLDMERDFDPELILRWIESLKGAYSSRIVHIGALNSIFEDSIAMGWLDPAIPNPLDRPVIRKVIKQMLKSAKTQRPITFLSESQVQALLCTETSKVMDFRRIRYLVGLGTGLRDHEIQGLTWNDIHFTADVPYLLVNRQLDKIGSKPLVTYEDLCQRGLSKDEITAIPNAVVSAPKYGSKRPIPLLPIVVAVLGHWKARGWHQYVGKAPAKDDPVFPSGKGNRHSPAGQFAFVESPQLLRLDLKRVGQAAQCNGKDLDFHALRRTFATLLNNHGVSEAEVGVLLGHGAKSVARGHYIASDVLTRRLENLRRLPLPDRVQLKGIVIDVSPDGSNVVTLRRKAE